MQLGYTQLTPEERERRLQNHLCLYCRESGHRRINCTVRPARSVSLSSSNISSLTIRISMSQADWGIDCTALIDSGAAGNCMSWEFARRHKLTLLPCESVLAVEALDGRPIGNGRIQHVTKSLNLQIGALHKERINFYIIQPSRHPVILGLPWLRRHDPHISWQKGQILQWGSTCLHQCLDEITKLPVQTINIQSLQDQEFATLPTVYSDLTEVFSQQSATHLPPHRPYDCAIELLPGTIPPKGRIFPLSQPESEAMNSYIQEELGKGFIRPSTSPAAAGFFFVKKKDGNLRPCIDYRGLNEITVKYRYPLPLVPAALEQLRQAKIYTKLDLRSAYNLIRIKQGDEWKSGFSTTRGHYEYTVMPFGLANSPSVFQAFMNDVFRDMLDQWVIVYIDDILIYSNTVEEHIQHVRTVLQRLIHHHLYAKLEKCEFHLTSVSFLVYIISAEGVTMDERKVTAVQEWPLPQTLKQLQRFLGFANFYRRFIRIFSTLAPL